MTAVHPHAAARSFVRGLKCRECAREYEKAPQHVCEFCFGPLEVAYDYDAIARTLTREAIVKRAPSLWRFRELLPLDGPATVGEHAGWTPLVRARRLEKKL